MSSKAVEDSPVKSTALAVNAQDAMKNISKKFIGAVEDEWQLYSDCAADYTIGAPIGFGASSIVYTATYRPSSPLSSSPSQPSQGVPCALKVVDLDKLPPRSLQLLQRETTLMSLSKHPNVLRVRGSWIDGHKLYIALRLMNKGSAADVMRYGWPGGMEEDVVRCILMQALKGLNYLHINGFIHRDVKAANLLIDDDGTVLLGDLGVAADLSEDTSRTAHPPKPYSTIASASLPHSNFAPINMSGSGSKRGVVFGETTPGVSKPTIGKRKSFVGTPCWMAPELIQGRQYDSSADIWSFGITAIELAHGRPPRSRESPQKVLLKTIQEDSPTLQREDGVFRYSRVFKEVVDSCLVKDPAKRPTADELLQTPFFKASRKPSYLINTILKDLPPLVQRQERQVLPPPMSANSIDSWDFTTTVHSPMTSVYRRHVLEDMVAEEERVKVSGVFEMEDDLNSTSSRGHSRVVSWAGKPVDQNIPERDEEIAPSSSPSTSESSAMSSNIGPSSTPLATSAASSYTNPSASEIEHKRQAGSNPQPPNLGNERQEPGTSINSHRDQLVGSNNVLPVSASVPHMIKGTGKILPSSSSGPTLWDKLKSTAKKPSRSDLSAGEVTPKDKDKGRMGEIFSSASKGLLSRASKRPISSSSKDSK